MASLHFDQISPVTSWNSEEGSAAQTLLLTYLSRPSREEDEAMQKQALKALHRREILAGILRLKVLRRKQYKLRLRSTYLGG